MVHGTKSGSTPILPKVKPLEPLKKPEIVIIGIKPEIANLSLQRGKE
jgi:hypothetical protein